MRDLHAGKRASDFLILDSEQNTNNKGFGGATTLMRKGEGKENVYGDKIKICPKIHFYRLLNTYKLI